MSTAAFAVTTRSGLRGYRHFPLMFVASLRIRRQLARTPGCLRWASIIAGPREFWTITVWESRDKMLDFMRSGAHEDIMWLFAKWLRSFWLMRWKPTADEQGGWTGLRMAKSEAPEQEPHARTPEAQAALAAALDALPHLKASTAPHGAPTYETSAAVRRHLHAVAGAGAVMVRIEVPHVRQALRAWRDLRVLDRQLAEHPEVLRHVIGIAKPRELYALAVLRDDRAAAELLALPELRRQAARWGNGFWAMRWQPANEFGHWDGLRLRKVRLGTMIPVPPRALRAARGPAGGPAARRSAG